VVKHKSDIVSVYPDPAMRIRNEKHENIVKTERTGPQRKPALLKEVIT